MPLSTSRFERGFAHIFALIILVVGVAIGIYLVQNPQIFSPKASENSALCKASDPTTFKQCLAAAENSPVVTQIEVTNQITCKTKEECSFLMLKRATPLTIFGTPNTGAGFKRMNNYDYPLLVFGNIGETDFSKIAEIKDLTVKNLIFDETTTKCDFVERGVGQCNSPLVLAPKLINPVIDNITILHAKAHGMQIKGAFNLVIKNSKIIDSEGNGIWFDRALSDGCTVDFANYKLCPIDPNKITTIVQIENNLFAENKVAGIELYASAYEQYPSSVKGNMFIHNHRDSKYIFCPQPDPQKGIVGGHCPGGQLVISRSKHMNVEENVIRDGKIDAMDPVKGITYHQQGLLATGIELADEIENVTIKNNKIYNNTGAAIYADYVGDKYKVSKVNVFWNMVYGNGIKFGGQGFPDLEKAPGFSFINNIGERADVPFREAFIYADPPVCVPQTPNGQCLSTIHWYTNDHREINVRLAGNAEALLAYGTNGKQDVPWVPVAGVTFVLEEPSTKAPLDSVFAKAFGQIVAATPVATVVPTAPPTIVPTSVPTPFPSLSPTALPTTSQTTPPAPNPTRAPAATPAPTPIPTPRAKIILSAAPNPCTLNTTGLCTARISWNSDAYRAQIDPGEPLKISIRENPGSLFASAAQGAQDAPWIGINGATFDVHYKGVLIDSLFVYGVNR